MPTLISSVYQTQFRIGTARSMRNKLLFKILYFLSFWSIGSVNLTLWLFKYIFRLKMKKGYELSLPEHEKEDKDPKFGSLWRGLNETTTAHGIPRLRQYQG